VGVTFLVCVRGISGCLRVSGLVLPYRKWPKPKSQDIRFNMVIDKWPLSLAVTRKDIPL